MFKIGLWVLFLSMVFAQNKAEASFPESTPVSYSSMFKLYNEPAKKWLRSHEIKFPRIGVFSLTGFQLDDVSNYWQVLEEFPYQTKTYNEVVRCGESIRISSVLIGYSIRLDETSFGLTTELLPLVHGVMNEQADAAVNWRVMCVNKQAGQTLFFGDQIKLKHSVTGKYISLDPSSRYTEFNCRGCEIVRQIEIHGIDDPTEEEKTLFTLKPALLFGSDHQPVLSTQ